LVGHSAGAHLAVMALLSSRSSFHLVKGKQFDNLQDAMPQQATVRSHFVVTVHQILTDFQ